MKRSTFIPALLLVLIFSAYRLVTTTWFVKSEGTKITFELPADGTKGTFSGLKADIKFDANAPADSRITASIEAKTINTGNEQRDNHLRTADFFDVEKYPLITFTSDKITAADKGFIAHGTLTIKDVTKEVEIPFTFENNDKDEVFKGSISVSSGDYGVMKKSKTGKDQVNITIEVPVTK
jgi:polyisoprenoid-binding protein YceI